jgi:hypothetical protein
MGIFSRGDIVEDVVGQIATAFLVVLSGNVATQTGIPVANLFGSVISAHSGFRIKLSASLTTHILGLMGW